MSLNYYFKQYNIDPNEIFLPYKNNDKETKITLLIKCIIENKYASPLINSRFINLHASDSNGSTPLMFAVSFKRTNLMYKLINNPKFYAQDCVSKCSICRENKVEVQIYRCGHTFHKKCLTKWTREFDAKTTLPRCPNCNTIYLRKHIDILQNVFDRRNKDGRSAMSWSIRNDNWTAFSMLVNRRANINIQDHDLYTPLMRTVMNNQPGIFNSIIAHPKTDINMQNKYNCSALMLSVVYARRNMFNKLLEEKKIDINRVDINGFNALAICIIYFTRTVFPPKGMMKFTEYKRLKGNTLIAVKKMCECKADVNQKDNMFVTPLMHAVKGGHYDIVKMLIKYNGDINVISKKGNTPLMWAAYYDNFKICKYLVDEKADITHSNKDDNSAISWAIEHGSLKCVKFFNECINAEKIMANNNLELAFMVKHKSKRHDEILNLMLEKLCS